MSEPRESSNPDIEAIVGIVDGMCMDGLVLPENEGLPNSWVLIVDIGDEIRVFMDHHSKAHTSMGLCEYARTMVLHDEFNEV